MSLPLAVHNDEGAFVLAYWNSDLAVGAAVLLLPLTRCVFIGQVFWRFRPLKRFVEPGDSPLFIINDLLIFSFKLMWVYSFVVLCVFHERDIC